jgi:hypothetical protein
MQIVVEADDILAYLLSRRFKPLTTVSNTAQQARDETAILTGRPSV